MAETVGLAIGSPALPTSLLYGLGTPAGNRESENYIREFESLVRDQKRVLYDTLEAFFGGKMPRTKLRELLSDPLSPGWRSQDMEIALRHSLGNSGNSIFLDLISQLFQTIKSLEHSLRKITDGSRATHIDPGSGVRLVAAVEGRKNKAEDFRRTHKYVEDLEIQDESFQSFVQAAVASTDLIGKQAIENLVASLAVLREIDRVASAVEDLATGEVAENQGTAGDSESTYSVKSEVVTGEASLSYLPLSMTAATEPRISLETVALLDTGATACAISWEMFSRLDLAIEKAEANDHEVVQTAAMNQTLSVHGKTRLNLRWQDSHGTRFGTRLWVYVVYGLAPSVLLSHDFTKLHSEVWSIAKTVAPSVAEINVTWFNKTSKNQQEAEADFLRRRQEENTATANAQKRERLADLERRLGDKPAPTTATQSLAATTTASVTGSTNT